MRTDLTAAVAKWRSLISLLSTFSEAVGEEPYWRGFTRVWQVTYWRQQVSTILYTSW